MRLTLSGLLLLLSLAASGQGYKIQFKVDGLKDTTAYLAYYYGESTFVRDTARVNGKGEFTFDGKEPLPQGVYMLVLDKTRVMEMVVGKTQQFSMATKAEDYVKHMVVTGDEDNKLFFENMRFNMERHKEAEPFLTVLRDSTLREDQKKDAQAAFNKINERVLAWQEELVTKHPTTVTGRIFKSGKPVQVPEPPKKPDGTIDSTFQLRWYREHFFDNFDLADDALIRMPRPVYQEKINEYLDRLFVPQPDSLRKGIDFVISKAKKNRETYKYAVWLMVLKFQNPEIMGLDEVYVNLFDKYFASGEMSFWVNASLQKNLKEHADRLRKSLVGKTAPNLIMQDSQFQPRSMYDIKNKYTILFIFDPDCGHCREETPKLVSFYNKKKFDAQVYAVSIDTSMAKMRDFAKEYKMNGMIMVNGPRTYVGPHQDLYDAITTPSVYIIDRNKKIIGKKVPCEKLEEFFEQYERIERLRTAGKL